MKTWQRQITNYWSRRAVWSSSPSQALGLLGAGGSGLRFCRFIFVFWVLCLLEGGVDVLSPVNPVVPALLPSTPGHHLHNAPENTNTSGEAVPWLFPLSCAMPWNPLPPMTHSSTMSYTELFILQWLISRAKETWRKFWRFILCFNLFPLVSGRLGLIYSFVSHLMGIC